MKTASEAIQGTLAAVGLMAGGESATNPSMRRGSQYCPMCAGIHSPAEPCPDGVDDGEEDNPGEEACKNCSCVDQKCAICDACGGCACCCTCANPQAETCDHCGCEDQKCAICDSCGGCNCCCRC